MASTDQDQPDGSDNVVKITFELSFTKTVEVVSPGSNTLHDLRIICLPRHHHPIQLGPLGGPGEDPFRDDHQAALRKWADDRALLSVATAFVDAEFAREVRQAMPPSPELAATRPRNPDGC